MDNRTIKTDKTPLIKNQNIQSNNPTNTLTTTAQIQERLDEIRDKRDQYRNKINKSTGVCAATSILSMIGVIAANTVAKEDPTLRMTSFVLGSAGFFVSLIAGGFALFNFVKGCSKNDEEADLEKQMESSSAPSSLKS
jgi:hypothetical protein